MGPQHNDVRALQAAEGSPRNAATYYDPTKVQVKLNFATAYVGNMHLYAVDWDSNTRRESITIDDGSGPRTVALNAEFNKGAWVSFPVNVAAGGSVTVTVNREAGVNAVLSGIFLGDAGAPPSTPANSSHRAVGSAGSAPPDTTSPAGTVPPATSPTYRTPP